VCFLTFLVFFRVFCFRLDALVEWLSHSGVAGVLPPLCAFFLSDERAQDEVGEQ
jgi:hypothetical protein